LLGNAAMPSLQRLQILCLRNTRNIDENLRLFSRMAVHHHFKLKELHLSARNRSVFFVGAGTALTVILFFPFLSQTGETLFLMMSGRYEHDR
jgi:hypothetical protein